MAEEKKNIYIGHRYVPKIFGIWNQLESYEGLSIVTWEGTSYTSKQRVPEGVSIDNENYWVVTGNYNAQIETYREEVKATSTELKDASLKVEQVKNYTDVFVNLKNEGCTENIADADDNTTIIQRLVNEGKNIFVPFIVPISKTIILSPVFNQKKIIGGTRYSNGFLMVTDNVPMFKMPEYLINHVQFKTLSLSYVNFQLNNPNSIVFLFTDTRHKSWGWSHFVFDDLKVRNPYGFCKVEVEPIWTFTFSNIFVHNLGGYFIDAQVTGQLSNRFDNLTITNIEHASDTDHNVIGACFRIMGEFYINLLDLEDWRGNVLLSDEAYGELKNAHIERCYFDNMFILTGNFLVENIRAQYNHNMSTDYFGVFYIGGGQYSFRNLVFDTTTLNGEVGLLVVPFSTSPNNYRIDVKNMHYRDGDIQVNNNGYDNGVSNKIKQFVVDDIPFNQRYKYDSKPTNFDVKKGEVYYKQSPNDYIGWVAVENGYTNTTYTATANVTEYNGEVKIVGNTPVDAGIKTGDVVIIDNKYAVKVISLTPTSFFTDDYMVLTTSLTGASIRKRTVAEALKPFGAII